MCVDAANLALDDMYTGMLGALSAGPYLAITAADTGTGMSRETQERIFEPFFTTKEIGKGTGLGLSTVLTIVKGHGGAIDVQSEIGTGTTFKIYLPAMPGIDAAADGSEDALPRGKGELILVVDDEERISTLTQKALERYGYRVLTARHGAEAVALYAQHRDVAVVLMDMVLPVMDGPSAIAALRAIDPHIRVITTSGHTAKDTQARTDGALASVAIAKPYTIEALVRTVHDVLSDTGPASPARPG